MKKLIDKIVGVWNQPTDKVKPSIFAGIVVVVLMLSKNTDSKLVIIFGVISVFVMLIYTSMSILKHEDITKTLIYLIFGIMGIAVVIMYYFKSKGIDFYAFAMIFPILLILMFITGYFNVKKTGNKEKIKLMKISLILGIPPSIIFLVLLIYIIFFK